MAAGVGDACRRRHDFASLLTPRETADEHGGATERGAQDDETYLHVGPSFPVFLPLDSPGPEVLSQTN